MIKAEVMKPQHTQQLSCECVGSYKLESFNESLKMWDKKGTTQIILPPSKVNVKMEKKKKIGG